MTPTQSGSIEGAFIIVTRIAPPMIPFRVGSFKGALIIKLKQIHYFLFLRGRSPPMYDPHLRASFVGAVDFYYYDLNNIFRHNPFQTACKI
jgi:hypothetical protein